MKSIALHSQGQDHHYDTLNDQLKKKIVDIYNDNQIPNPTKRRSIRILMSKFAEKVKKLDFNLY